MGKQPARAVFEYMFSQVRSIYEIQTMNALTQHFLVASLVVVLASILTGCGSDEPDNKLIQQLFVKHSGGYEDLLRMFREDLAKSNISFVSAESASRTQCELRPQRHECALPIEKWEDYQRRMNQLGILWVEHNEPAGRFYFVTYYEPILMNARLRGIVYSDGQAIEVSTYYPKQEWSPIQGGWHTFLMIDD
jgi:hypothetical protein